MKYVKRLLCKTNKRNFHPWLVLIKDLQNPLSIDSGNLGDHRTEGSTFTPAES